MDIAALLAAIGVGTALGSLLQHRLNRKAEQRQRKINTDRATYQERMTRLIAGNIHAFIRSNRCRDGEREELAELIQNIADGAHRDRFLDPKVQAAWANLLEKTADCGWRRISERITEQEIAGYTQSWEAWMTAARDAFGPLSEMDLPHLRRTGVARRADSAA